MITMPSKDERQKPRRPFRGRLFGPGVDFWNRPEDNNDCRTDHAALLADGARRRRVAKRLVDDIRSAEAESK